MKFFNSNSITSKVWRLLAVAVLTLVTMLTIVYIELHNIINTISETKRVGIIVDELILLGENLVDLENSQRGYLITENEQFLLPFPTSKVSISQRLKKLDLLVKDAGVRQHLNQMHPVIKAKLDFINKCVELVQQGQIGQAIELVKNGRGKELMDNFHRLRKIMQEREIKLLNQHTARYEQELFYIQIILVVGGIFAVYAMSITAVNATKKIKGPIDQLLQSISLMAEGKLDYKINSIEKNEIGLISNAFNNMADKINESGKLREETLAELQRSNADLDKFAYVASHDLKAPLRGIRSLAQWIAEDVAETASKDTMENLELLNSRVDRLDGLLESLLAYSRIGHKTESPKEIDIANLIDDIADYLAPDPSFLITYKGNVSTFFTSKVPFELVLRNLISNSIKHHDHASGQINVYAKEFGDLVEFRVQDDGPGIPDEFKERIFEMFQTLKPRDQVEGSGMGLAIVKKTIEIFGGKIRVESILSQRGSSFIFTWKKQFPNG